MMPDGHGATQRGQEQSKEERGAEQTVQKHIRDQPGLLEIPEGEFLQGSGFLHYK